MTFHGLRNGPIFRAVVIILIAWFVVVVGCALAYMMMRFGSRLEPDMSEEEQREVFQEENDRLAVELEDESTLQRITALVLGLLAALTLPLAWWTASRHAISPEQATGYGLVIGLSVAVAFFACTLGGLLYQPLMLIVLALTVASGVFGGWVGGHNPRPRPERIPAPSFDPLSQYASTGSASALPPGSKPETYYNMGVQAALAGRREEARQHFTRVLQMQPRSVAAWLQLANLADTPEQAWNYVQQARSINAADPAVMHAVDMIWPKVAAQAQQTAPRAQPPYSGGAQDDTGIPRTTLPGGEAIPPLPTGPSDEEPDSDTPQA